MLRVLHCRAPQIFGGPEKQILGLMAHGEDMAVSQQLLVIGRGSRHPRMVVEEAQRRGLAANLVESRGRFDFRPLVRLSEIAREGNCDIICTHGYLPDILGSIVARRLRRRLVSVAHGYTSKTRTVRAYEWVDIRLLRGFDRVVAVSDALRERLTRHGVPSRLVTTIRNAVDMIEPAPRSEARARLGLPPDEFVVGCVGRLSPEKGHRFLLEAMALLAERGLRARAAICGEGPELPALLSQRSRHGLDDTVTLAGHRSDVESLLSAFDVFVLPSLTEGIPVALLEAASAGLPAVASAVGGVPEVVVDGETGLLVPPRDSAALADAIQRLHGDRLLAQEMGAAARARVSREFSRAAQAARYREVFEKVLGA